MAIKPPNNFQSVVNPNDSQTGKAQQQSSTAKPVVSQQLPVVNPEAVAKALKEYQKMRNASIACLREGLRQ